MSTPKYPNQAPETYAVEIHDAAAQPHHTEHRKSRAQSPESAALHQWQSQTADNGFGLTPGSSVKVFTLDVIDGSRRDAEPVKTFTVERRKTGSTPFVLVEA